MLILDARNLSKLIEKKERCERFEWSLLKRLALERAGHAYQVPRGTSRSSVADHKLSNMAEEETVVSIPVVKVIHIWEKNSVELGFDEYGSTVESASTMYAIYPYNFKAVNKSGKEPLIKTFGSLIRCDGGTLTMGENQFRIQLVEQSQQQQLQVSRAIFCSSC